MNYAMSRLWGKLFERHARAIGAIEEDRADVELIAESRDDTYEPLDSVVEDIEAERAADIRGSVKRAR